MDIELSRFIGLKETAKIVTLPFEGLYELVSPLLPVDTIKGIFVPDKAKLKQKSQKERIKGNKKAAIVTANLAAYQCYKNYKKAHRMIHW